MHCLWVLLALNMLVLHCTRFVGHTANLVDHTTYGALNICVSTTLYSDTDQVKKNGPPLPSRPPPPKA